MTKIKKISAIMVAAVILCTCFLMSGCGGDTESSSSEKATSAVSNEETTSASTDTTNYKSSYTAIIDVKDYGKIEVELYEELAPITVKNFVDLAKDGFYDGLTFHRIITGFMIQGGGFEPGMKQKETKSPIQNEANNGLKNTRGTLAMARTQAPHSATAQFFINVADNDFLNFSGESLQGWGYCVFAEVVEGMDVVDKIKAVATGRSGMHQDVPKDDVIIKSVTVSE